MYTQLINKLEHTHCICLDKVQTIFNEQNQSKNRRRMGIENLFCKIGNRRSKVRKFREGRVRDLEYIRFRKPNERITNPVTKSRNVKKVVSGMLMARAGSTNYDLSSSSTNKLTGTSVHKTKLPKTQASEVSFFRLVETDQQFVNSNNLNNEKVVKCSQNMSNHVRLLYKNKSVTKVFVELINDQLKVDQFHNLLNGIQTNCIMRVVDLADTGYLSSELVCKKELQSMFDEVRISVELRQSHLLLIT